MAVLIEEAFDLIKKMTYSNLKTEMINIEESSNRISAEQILATYPLPRFDNSAMDGYAILEEDANLVVDVIGKILAGDNQNLLIEEKTAIKIMTGARIPSNTTAIVPQEDVENIDNNKIKLPVDIRKSQHIRYIGEDIAIGDSVVKKYQEINFAIISLLASQGITKIKVFKKPRVAVFASGEELRPHFEDIEDHQIYNSNSPSLIARLKELACDVEFIGSARDNLESLKDHVNRSLDFDLVITSGGVSVGEADFTKEAFESFNIKYIFNGIIIKPGKPTVFGKINNTYVLNLPGNPLASQIIFEMFGTKIVQLLKSDINIYHKPIRAKIKTDLKNKKGRVTLIPGIFDGEYFIPSIKRAPGMVSVMSQCDCYIILDKNVTLLTANSMVQVINIKNKTFLNIQKDLLTYENQ
jgi:molybdopterin molybdotransferase